MEQFSDLLGKTIIAIKVNKTNEADYIDIVTKDGDIYQLYHIQDCCEGVSIEDISGDLDDLLYEPLIVAEEVISYVDPDDFEISQESRRYRDSFTWTFYRLATTKGYVTIRWYGEPNGYYSESVSFCKVGKPQYAG